jgi:hypothetical protein
MSKQDWATLATIIGLLVIAVVVRVILWQKFGWVSLLFR